MNYSAVCMFKPIAPGTTMNGKEIIADKNDNMPFILVPMSGSVPHKARIVNGTVAQREGISGGDTRLVIFNRLPDSEEYGEQWEHTFGGKEVSTLDIIQASAVIGVGKVVRKVTDKIEVKTEGED